MSPMMLGGIGLILLVFLMFWGLPICLCLGIVGCFGLATLLGWEQLLMYVMPWPITFTTSYVLCCLPMFMMMGFVVLESGYAHDMFDFAFKSVGRAPGGLVSACTVTSALFGAISGGGGAPTLAIIAQPSLKRYEYHEGISFAQIAAGGPIGGLIPPSSAAIIYAMVAKVSAGKQLMAGIFPGIILMVILIIMLTIRATLQPGMGRRAVGIPWIEAVKGARKIWFVAVIFLTMIYLIYGGICTPTEAAASGLFALIVLAVATGRLKWSGFLAALRTTVTVSGMSFAMLLGSSLFSAFIVLSRVPDAFATWVVGAGLSYYTALAIILLLYIPLGMFIDTISLIVIVVPILLPLVKAYGWDLTWFGILIRTMIGTATLSPPCAIGVYMVSAVTRVPLMTIFRQVPLPILCYVIAVLLFVFFPQLSLWIPSMMKM